jgi:hypothetical protein
MTQQRHSFPFLTSVLHTPFFFFVSSPTHKIFRMLSTMSRRSKSSNCSSHALLEVKNVFNSATGPSLISLVSNLNHALNERDDQEGNAAAEKDWGVSVWQRKTACLLLYFVCRRRHWELSSVYFMIDSADHELVCALLQLRLLFNRARGCMSLRHAAEAEGRPRGLVRRLACR